MEKDKGLTYKDSGVNIDAQDEALKSVSRAVKATFKPEVLSGIGAFGGLFKVPLGRYSEPVLVSSADGVGTKLKIAFMTGKHSTVGIDIVSHCVNDILVQGAEPLFFMDYVACGKLDPSVVSEVIKGVADGCIAADCTLLGGETAEMPGFYGDGEYDLAGFIVGMADREKIIDGTAIAEKNIIVGLPSSGMHTNGYSLARKLFFEKEKLTVDSFVSELGKTVGEELLIPHKCYAKPLRKALQKGLIKGMAHITGGGLTDNIPRILPDGLGALIDKQSWQIPPLFNYIMEVGKVPVDDMYRTFNMGIGMAVIIDEKELDLFKSCVDDEVIVIGCISKGSGEVSYV